MNRIWSVLLLALTIRLFVPLLAFFYTQDYLIFHRPDTATYLRPAENLLSTGQFTGNELPEILRTPGYPLLLIPGLLSDKTEAVTITLQILLSCLTCYLVFRASLLLFERHNVALLCALMYAVEPLSIIYTSILVTETLFTCLTVLSCYCLIKYIRQGSFSTLLISSVALSVSVYVRPINYFLPVLLSVSLIIWILARAPKKSVLWIHACVFFMVSMGLIGLWQLRNKHKAGYAGFSAITAQNLYFYQGASVLAVIEGIPYYQMQNKMGYRDQEVYYLNHPEQRMWNQSDRYRYMRKEGINILLNNPITYAKIHLKGMLRTLLDPGAMEYLKLFRLYPESGGLLGIIVDRGLLRTVVDLVSGMPLVFWSNLTLGLVLSSYLLLSGIALVSKNFMYDMPIVVLLTVGFYLLLVSGGPNSLDRFRHPLMPIFSILGGYGIWVIGCKIRAKRTSYG